MRTPLLALLALAAVLPCSAEEPAIKPSTAKKVLLLGDSHTVGPFGVSLDGWLRKGFGDEVATHAVCNATLTWWLSSKRRKLTNCHLQRPFHSKALPVNGGYETEPPSVGALMALPPAVVIIALGSNPDGSSMDDTITAAADLLSRLPGKSRCFWVGPPPMPSRLPQVSQFYAQFKDATARVGRSCTLIDSRDYLKPEQATKDHFYGKPAEEWGKAVFNIVFNSVP